MSPPRLEDLSKEELIRALRPLKQNEGDDPATVEVSQLIHDLEVHQIELEMQNRELREAQGALEESRARYADLYDFAPVVYFTLESSGRIKEANLTAAALFGLERANLVGRLLTSFVVREERQLLRQHLRRCFSEKIRVATNVTMMVRRQGRVVVQIVSTPGIGRGGDVVGCKTTLTDISALKRSEEKLLFLAQAGAVLASSFDYLSTIANVMRLAVPLLGDVCFADIVEPNGKVRRTKVICADPERAAGIEAALASPPALRDKTPHARVLRTGDPILIADCSLPPPSFPTPPVLVEHESLIRTCGAGSLLYVPVMSRGGTLGVFTLVSTEGGRRYSESDLDTVQDLAARTALAIDNARLYQDAQRAIQARQDLLSLVSHDLKSPLMGILLNAEILLRDAPAEDRRKGSRQLDRIRRGVQQMRHLVEDLVDLSSIETGRLSIELRDHDLREILQEVADMLAPLALEKTIALSVEIPDQPVQVRCDRRRVMQVFSNLVGNAVKFTPEGGQIGLSVERSMDDQVVIAVRDSGPGIPVPLAGHLFQRYWQAEETARQGQGLGLFISKRLVEAQGGTIWADSGMGQAGQVGQVEQGTTFYFTLPPATSSASPPLSRISVPPPSLRRPAASGPAALPRLARGHKPTSRAGEPPDRR
jgi:PAS domain S-box-containing protein